MTRTGVRVRAPLNRVQRFGKGGGCHFFFVCPSQTVENGSIVRTLTLSKTWNVIRFGVGVRACLPKPFYMGNLPTTTPGSLESDLSTELFQLMVTSDFVVHMPCERRLSDGVVQKTSQEPCRLTITDVFGHCNFRFAQQISRTVRAERSQIRTFSG